MNNIEHCNAHIEANYSFPFISEDWLGASLILTLFLTGLIASFTHCIGMCGPIAAGQMSLRLISLKSNQMTQWNKIKCALSIPYYLGKSITYVLLLTAAFFFSTSMQNLPWVRGAAIILLLATAMLFLYSGFTQTPAFLKLKFPFMKRLTLTLNNLKIASYKNAYGLSGVLVGIILGFIPCGIVYAAIVTIVSNATSYWVAVLSMLAFGLATIPGLFTVSYIGGSLLRNSKNLLMYLYSAIMFFNAYLLVCSAYKLFGQGE